jgi:hypothetical protein
MRNFEDLIIPFLGVGLLVTSFAEILEWDIVFVSTPESGLLAVLSDDNADPLQGLS